MRARGHLALGPRPIELHVGRTEPSAVGLELTGFVLEPPAPE